MRSAKHVASSGANDTNSPIVDEVDVTEGHGGVGLAVLVGLVSAVARARRTWLHVRVPIGTDDEGVRVPVVETVVAALPCKHVGERCAICTRPMGGARRRLSEPRKKNFFRSYTSGWSFVPGGSERGKKREMR